MGGGTPLIVNDVNNTLDKTWQEIHDAFVGGQTIIIQTHNSEDDYEFEEDALVSVVAFDSDTGCRVSTKSVVYTTQQPNGYPVSRDR